MSTSLLYHDTYTPVNTRARARVHERAHTHMTARLRLSRAPRRGAVGASPRASQDYFKFKGRRPWTGVIYLVRPEIYRTNSGYRTNFAERVACK
jgi:hypothetical protein